MPTHQDYMRSFRRVTQRVASAAVAVASVLLFATCDLDKISGTPKPLDQATIDKVFSIVGDSVVTLGGTLALTITSSADLTHTSKRWSSDAKSIATVDSTSGVVSGLALGVVSITARLLAPELDTGYTRTHVVRVRYKGIKVATIDSITGLNLSRAVVVNGTNFSNAIVTPVVTTATFTTHDSGSTASTFTAISGQTVVAKKPGKAYVIAAFEAFKDSVSMKVRQVAKSITFPTTEYVAGSVGVNRTISATVKDVNDSLIVSPVVTWRVNDTSVALISATTGSLRAKKVDTTSIFATSDTVTKRWLMRVVQVSDSIAIVDGNNQTAAVGSAVAIPPQVAVLDSGNTAIASATVAFAASGGGQVTGATQTTNAQGRATVGSWTLGTVAGTQNLAATSGNAVATISVTATAGPPAALAFEVQPVAAGIAATMAPAVKVKVVDANGNLVTTATDAVALALGANPGAATLGGTLAQSAVNGIATFANLTVSAGGSGYTLVANSGTLAGVTSNSFNVFGPAAKLAFEAIPANVVVSRAIAPPVRVRVEDAQGNRVATATNQITLTLAANPGNATFAGTTIKSAAFGFADFSDLTLNQIANGYQITASAAGLTSGTSTAFNVIAVGPPTTLLFITEPTNTVATSAINASTSPAGIRVAVVDAGGATVTSSTQSITLSILNNAGTGSLSGTTSQAASSGIATFAGLSINKVGTGYTLLATATGSSLSSDTSATFNITVGAASKLGYIVPPSNINSGGTITPAVQVAVQDAGGNTVAGTTHSVTVASSSTGLTGTTTQTVSSTTGIATFSSLVHTGICTCTLTTSSAPTLTSASAPYSVVAAGQATKLRFLTEPSNAAAGVANSPAIQVEVTDGSGTRVTAGSYIVTLALGANPGGASLTAPGASSTNPVTTSSGLATFFNIKLDKVGSGYTLVASTASLTSATSQPFNITHGSASQLAFTTQPSNGTAGIPINPAVVLTVQDQFGNTVLNSSASVRVAVATAAPGDFTVTGTNQVQAANGVATFSNLRFRTAGTYTLFAEIPATSIFSSGNSASFTVAPAPAFALDYKTQPASTTAGQPISPAVQVQVVDSLGNLINTATDPITVAIATGVTGATLSGTKTVNAVAGVATFSNLSIDKSSQGVAVSYSLGASAANLASATSNFFEINPTAASKLLWQRTPVSTIRNAPLATGSGEGLEVIIADAFGNQVFSNSSALVTVSFLANPGGATLGGTLAKTASFGSVVFDNLTVSAAGTGYTLQATSAPVTSASTPAFDVAAFGAASKTVFTTQPSTVIVGATMPQVQVSIQDQFNNRVTSGTGSTETVFLFFASGGNPTNATLLGSTNVAAVAGVATFPNLSLDKVGTAYQLGSGTATVGGFPPSNSFNVTAGEVPLATGASYPWDVVVNGGTVYWSEGTAIRKVPAAGGAVTPLVTTGITDAVALTTDGSFVYWIEAGGSIKKVPVGGGGTTTLISAAAAVAPRIEVDGTHVYYYSAPTQAGPWKLRRIDKAAVFGAPPAIDLYDVNAPGPDIFSPFALSGGNLFFSNGTQVLRGPSGGGGATTQLNGGENGHTFTVSGATLYYQVNNNLRSVPTAGGSVNFNYPQLPSTGGKLASDGTNVYWSHGTATAGVYRTAAAGGSSTLYTFSTDAIWGIALDATNQYWVKDSAGTTVVIKASK